MICLSNEKVVRKYLPINFFDDDMTQQLFEYINKNAKVPKRNQMRSLIHNRFAELKLQVKELLHENSSKISFGIDGWKSVAQQSYYGVQGHENTLKNIKFITTISFKINFLNYNEK